MDREPEQRRDLAPAAVGQNRMGGERFTVIERTYDSFTVDGKRILTSSTVTTGEPFLPVKN